MLLWRSKCSAFEIPFRAMYLCFHFTVNLLVQKNGKFTGRQPVCRSVERSYEGNELLVAFNFALTLRNYFLGSVELVLMGKHNLFRKTAQVNF